MTAANHEINVQLTLATTAVALDFLAEARRLARALVHSARIVRFPRWWPVLAF